MEIKSAEFVISNTNVKKCPTGDLPEYAFIGRSNVGKSSLINMLTGKKGLAMTSQKPGKTLLINHFLINGQWYLVDLPGYGFAQRGKEGRENIQRIIEDYILEREQLTNLKRSTWSLWNGSGKTKSPFLSSSQRSTKSVKVVCRKT